MMPVADLADSDHTMHHVFAMLLLTTLGTAQTYIVDAAGGTGSQFTSIAAAVATVPSGAVLQVRAGTYAPFSIVGKGLSILGLGGVQISGTFFAPVTITVSGTSGSQSVVLRDLFLSVPLGGPHRIDCNSCQGPVFIQRVGMDTTYGAAREIRAQLCSQVFVEASGPFASSQGGAGIDLLGSKAVIHSCVSQSGGAGLRANISQLQITDCTLGGLPTLSLNAATVRIAGTSTLLQGLGPTINGSGTVLVDPAVVIMGTSTVSYTVAGQSTVAATGGSLGTPVNATMRGPAGHLGVLYLGRLGPPQPLAGFQHDSWLAAGSGVAGALGVFGPPLTSSVLVPANPLLLGSLFVWQGATYDPVAGFAASIPALFTP
jgi:hypothetical protein